MSSAMDYISFIAIMAVVAGVLIALHNFLKESIYEWFAEKISNPLVKPSSWVFNKILRLFDKLNYLIFKAKGRYVLPFFGGPGRLVLMALMLVTCGLVLSHIVTTADDLHEFFLNNILLKAPPMYIISLIVEGKDGLNIFDVKNLVDIVLTSAFTIAFFYSNRQLNIFIQIVYNLIFSLFFTMMPYFIPEFVYVLPAAVYGVFFDFMMGAFDALSMANLGFFGILLAIIALILFIVGMLISLYIIVTVAAVAIRELIASFVYSMFATLAILIAAVIVEAIFGTSSGLYPEIILTIVVFGLTLVINAWRSSDDAFLEDNDPNYMPRFARWFLSAKNKIQEAYRKNA